MMTPQIAACSPPTNREHPDGQAAAQLSGDCVEAIEHYNVNTIERLLDDAADRLRALGDKGPDAVLPAFSRTLDEVRHNIGDAARWRQFCKSVLHSHPITKVLDEDPFTKHSATQPRGYPGDAALIDYIYRLKEPEGATCLGQALFRYSTNVQSSAAVRERRALLATQIDEVAAERPEARVLSIAAGHLREAELSSAIKDRAIGNLIAFDQDHQSLETIRADYGNGQLVTHHGTVRSLISEKHDYQNFDFVYAAGLFDYLADRTAKRLTRVMFDMLAPGGRLLIANFAPSLPDIGYMEAFMRWELIYRDEPQMASLIEEIPIAEIERSEVTWNSTRCMLFLTLTKRMSTC